MRFVYISILLLCLHVAALAQTHTDTTVGIDVKGGRTYQETAHILCDGLRGDQLKANAIYNWITHNIRYDVEAVQKGKYKDPKPDKVYRSRIAVCEGYAELYAAMCNEAGLKAVTIDGYAKDWIFDNGDKLTIPRHAWCAVLISAQWQFVEPTWGAGGLYQAPTTLRKIINTVTFKKVTYAQRLKFRFKYNSEYFLQDPLTFRLKHLPTDPVWQLTDTAMPLVVFEAGDSAVMQFNKKYDQLKQNSGELMRIASMDEDSAKFEATDRAYTFNERFPLALAMKQNARVSADVDQVLKEKDPEKGEALWKDAEKRLKIAQAHVKEQKKFFPDQYNTLKKKNRTKNMEAKQYMMQMATDNKKLLAQCTKYKKNASAKYTKNRKKYATAEKRTRDLDSRKINDLEPSKQQKPSSAPEMLAISDSVAARERRIDSFKADIAKRTARIAACKDSNKVRLDSLAHSLSRSDSFLMGEAIARLNMHDNYDDEVIKWSGLYKGEKYAVADTLHKYYTTYYDSVLQMSDDRYKAHVQMMDCYKKNLKDIEKYAKWNSSDTAVTDRYAGMVADYSAAIDSCGEDLMQTITYIRANGTLFAGLGKLYKRQLKIVAYMKQVEDIRKKLEANYITGKQNFDNKENKKQDLTLKAAIKTMQAAYK